MFEAKIWFYDNDRRTPSPMKHDFVDFVICCNIIAYNLDGRSTYPLKLFLHLLQWMIVICIRHSPWPEEGSLMSAMSCDSPYLVGDSRSNGGIRIEQGPRTGADETQFMRFEYWSGRAINSFTSPPCWWVGWFAHWHINNQQPLNLISITKLHSWQGYTGISELQSMRKNKLDLRLIKP